MKDRDRQTAKRDTDKIKTSKWEKYKLIRQATQINHTPGHTDKQKMKGKDDKTPFRKHTYYCNRETPNCIPIHKKHCISLTKQSTVF